ncbi:MAG TPA: DUF2214 family protein [Polyangiaceae bacterium]
MMLRLSIAALHLVSMVLGVTFLVQRANSLRVAQSAQDLSKVLFWDNLYGLVAIAWLGSGMMRAFSGLEKGSDYYLHNHVFWSKLLFVAVLLASEAPVMVALIRLRVNRARHRDVDVASFRKLVRLHWYELIAVVFAVIAATLMARGVGYVAPK